jgi:hypothetical protein
MLGILAGKTRRRPHGESFNDLRGERLREEEPNLPAHSR